MFDTKNMFDKFTSAAKKVVDVTQDVIGNVTENQVKNVTRENHTSHTMYEVFVPALALTFGVIKRFVITEDSLIYGNDEYKYSEITPIHIVNPPFPMSNGTASTIANGKELVLAYEYSQKERFAKAMLYANEQIDLANNTVRKYKYILQADQGTKFEVYENYIILYALKTGLGNTIGNSMRGGAVGQVIYFTDMTVALIEEDDNVWFEIKQTNNNTLKLMLNKQQTELAETIVSYITKQKTTKKEENTNGFNITWDVIKGKEKYFSLCGTPFVISADMDIFNTYRLRFRELASQCADTARREYNTKVQNLTTYLEFFPKIYLRYLNVLTQKAIDILISENIWTVTHDSFTEEHVNNFHIALDEYLVTTESIKLSAQANQNNISKVMNFVPELVGGGFGVKGAVKGIATATAFNLVRDGVELEFLKGASQINHTQQMELYKRIQTDKLFEFVFIDYWRVFLSLTFTLKQNGKQMWYLTDDMSKQANNVFSNLSNPNFPQDKLVDAFIGILKTNPYNADYHKYMMARFGDTKETQEIKNYFGYTDFSNPRIS